MILILIGAGLLVVVVLTHVAEAFQLLPWMGWGLPNSPGHYVDLVSAIGGVAFIATGLAERFFRKGPPPNSKGATGLNGAGTQGSAVLK